jgi:hypothetical protein
MFKKFAKIPGFWMNVGNQRLPLKYQLGIKASNIK